MFYNCKGDPVHHSQICDVNSWVFFRGVDKENFAGLQSQFADNDDFPPTEFADKEGFSRISTSTSTNGVHPPMAMLLGFCPRANPWISLPI